MIRARLNSKGAIAAPGAAQIAGSHIVLRKPDTVDIDAAGFLGREVIVSHTIECSEGLTLVPGTGPVGQSWAMRFEGAGTARLSFTSASGREWSGTIRVRGNG